MTGTANGLVLRFSLAVFLWSCYIDGVGGSFRWTIYYNQPPDQYGDDQSLTTLRNDGYTICRNNTPESAECRVKGRYSTFTEINAKLKAPDHLHEPCTKNGIVCFNNIERNQRCSDYMVRFYCPEEEADDLEDDNDGEEMDPEVGADIISLGFGGLLLVCVLYAYLRILCKRRWNDPRHRHFPRDINAIRSAPDTCTSPSSNRQQFDGGTGRDSFLQRETTNSSVESSHIDEYQVGTTQNDIYQISTDVLPGYTEIEVPNLQRLSSTNFAMEDNILLNRCDMRTSPPSYNEAMSTVDTNPPSYADVQNEQATTAT